VLNAIGDVINLCLICKDIRIYFFKYCFLRDLFVLDFGGFDVILGKDWLSEKEAVVECAERRIVLEANCGKVLENIWGRKPNGCMDSFLYSLDSSQEELGSTEVVNFFWISLSR